MISKLLWAIFCINMWGMLIIGTMFVGLGLVANINESLWAAMMIGGETVQTANQKTAWYVLNSSVAALGGIFVYLQSSGQLRFTAQPPNRKVE